MMKKRVLVTVNPYIIAKRYFSTMRKFLNLMDQHFDLLILPINGYDFKHGEVRAFRRLKDGAFKTAGVIKPEGDLWFVYSDGYYLNHRRFGFRLRRDYFKAQLEFHQKHLDGGSVSLMVNHPEAEARTLKSWFATLNFKKTRVIPTYVFKHIDEVYDFQKLKGSIVVKPNWGGGSTEVEWLKDERAVRKFQNKLKKRSDRDLSDYCFQIFCQGDEKRLWFVGGEFVAGRKYRGRETPWEDWNEKCRISAYNNSAHQGFAEDLAAAQYVCKLSGISVGAIDFIGHRINEINGCGTVMTTLDKRKMFVDTRPAFVDYLLKLTN
jgi:glutathione synthase/RimK-type ligase-like ATP-grasp enzyme